MSALRILPCLDSAQMAESRRQELDIPRDVAAARAYGHATLVLGAWPSVMCSPQIAAPEAVARRDLLRSRFFLARPAPSKEPRPHPGGTDSREGFRGQDSEARTGESGETCSTTVTGSLAMVRLVEPLEGRPGLLHDAADSG